MTKYISDVLRVMRLAIGRRNANDPDSNDSTLIGYINDFMTLSMSDDIKIFEQWGTLLFDIDENSPDGVYDFPGAETASDFVNVLDEAMVSKVDAVTGAISWYNLSVYSDPQTFFTRWGYDNETDLVRGAPSEMLYYGNQFTFRTLPDDEYQVRIYGYKSLPELTDGTNELPFSYWMRYLAYGAAAQYAADYRLDGEAVNNIDRNFKSERLLLLKRTHTQAKNKRCIPRF